MNKYKNKKVMFNGELLDSKRERDRYAELLLMQKGGLIKDLRRQVEFRLIESQYSGGKCLERAVKYIADFVYEQDGKTVVEDTKSPYLRKNDKAWIIKRKLMLERFQIQVKEI